MEQKELKPCPFCGGGAVFEEYAYHTDGRIICTRCGATSSNEWTDSSGKNWKAKAAEKWNRRANDNAEKHGHWHEFKGSNPIRIACSECGHPVNYFWDDWRNAKFCPHCGVKMDGDDSGTYK